MDPEPLDGRGDVRRDVLERELGRVDADDHQPVLAVGRVPGLEVGQRSQTVDARIGPEVDQHDLAAQRCQRERRTVEPAAARVQLLRLAVRSECRSDRLRGLRAAQLRELPSCGRIVLDLRLEERGVAGYEPRDSLVEVEGDPERDGTDDRA